MDSLWANIALVLLFILLGALFAASEIALISLRESQIRALAERGRSGAAVARLTQDSNRFLSAVQIGVTLAGFFSASFGAAQIAPVLASGLENAGLQPSTAYVVAFVGTTLTIAYLSLVLGELVPKRLAMMAAERTSLLVARPLDLLATAMRPLIWLLSVSTNAVVRLLGRDPDAQREDIGPEELRLLVAEHKSLSVKERDMVVGMLSVGERTVDEVMTPRTEVDFIDAAMPIEEARGYVTEREHSRYPITGEDTDHILGFLHVRDLLVPPATARVVGDLIRPTVFFPGSKLVLGALSEMQGENNHLAIVVDEYGGTDGIVTIEDVLEEFVGQIRDEYDLNEIASSISLDDDEVPGLLGRADAVKVFGVELPEGGFDTLGGFVLEQLGRLAEVGDTVRWDNRVLEVIALDGHRVDLVRVTTVETEAEAAAEDVSEETSPEPPAPAS
ncbi:MAG: hemolysin family protein [Dermatophilaceae bacterium]|nr:hemolysin family protein [Intrasporangiaceae bacterium]